MPASIACELWYPGHGAILIHNLADYPCGMETGQSSQIYGSFGLASTYQDARASRTQWKDVAGTDQIGGFGCRIKRFAHRHRAVSGGYPRGCTLFRIDTHAKCCLEPRAIV